MSRKRSIRVGISVVVVIAIVVVGLLPWPTEGSRGVLYRVTNGEHTMYLLGSIHVGSRDMYPFGEQIESAMAKSTTFVYECDTTSADALASARARMILPEGETLQGKIGDALYEKLTQVYQKLGLKIESLQSLTPWAVVNTLAVYTTAAEMGEKSVAEALSLGVETQVQAYAQQYQKQVAYLETLDEQLNVLEGFSTELTNYLLQSESEIILHPESARGMDATITQWPQWWRDGDVDAFASHYLNGYLEPGYEVVCTEYHHSLITERNERMAARLVQLLSDNETYFVTVGLLHVVLPEDSLPVLLQEQGFMVELLSQP